MVLRGWPLNMGSVFLYKSFNFDEKSLVGSKNNRQFRNNCVYVLIRPLTKMEAVLG